jgi:hypothetical protein
VLETKEGVRFPWTGVTDGCELPCGCWESNPGPLQEQPMLLTTELALDFIFKLCVCVCVCVWCACECHGSQKPEALDPVELELTGSYEPCAMGTGNQTQPQQ